MKYLPAAFILFLAIACNHAEKHVEQMTDKIAAAADSLTADSVSIAPEPEVSVEYYAGVLPCADCVGIETEISLKSDNTYLVHTIYNSRKSKGPGSNEISETGTWMLHGADTIHLAERKNAPSMFIRTDSSLIQLDMKGKKITGKLADKYILKKLK